MNAWIIEMMAFVSMLLFQVYDIARLILVQLDV